MSKIDIPAARAIIAEATVGPWQRWDHTGHIVYSTAERMQGAHPVVVDKEMQDDDAIFIAAAREGWPAALDEVERLRASQLTINVADNVTAEKQTLALLTEVERLRALLVEAAAAFDLQAAGAKLLGTHYRTLVEGGAA